jgi:hypothetical protein
MTKRLYDDNLYRFDSPQPSYWEATAGDIKVNAPPLEGDESCDVAIIGRKGCPFLGNGASGL